MENVSLNQTGVEISQDALIHANNLRNSNIQKRQLKETITEIIRRICQELIISHRSGSHHLITTIPITFSIPNMSNKDSQRCVWAAVISEIKKKGYRIWISPHADECKIKITWMSPEDETDIKFQMDVIAKHTKRF